MGRPAQPTCVCRDAHPGTIALAQSCGRLLKHHGQIRRRSRAALTHPWRRVYGPTFVAMPEPTTTQVVVLDRIRSARLTGDASFARMMSSAKEDTCDDYFSPLH
jgi:hypothetical protein